MTWMGIKPTTSQSQVGLSATQPFKSWLIVRKVKLWHIPILVVDSMCFEIANQMRRGSCLRGSSFDMITPRWFHCAWLSPASEQIRRWENGGRSHLWVTLCRRSSNFSTTTLSWSLKNGSKVCAGWRRWLAGGRRGCLSRFSFIQVVLSQSHWTCSHHLDDLSPLVLDS